MNKKILAGTAFVAGAAAFVVFLFGGMPGNESGFQSPPNTGLELPAAQTILLPNVSGRIDHMDIDLQGQRLFVSELENNSLDVLDLRAGTRIHSIGGLDEPQGVAFVPGAKRLVVANGGDGTVRIYDSENYSLVSTIALSGDADNVRYDDSKNLVYVGFGNGGIAVIDPAKGDLVSTIRLDGHPESFQISGGPQPTIFVNVPESNSIEAIGLQKMSVAKWQNNGASGNYPMALDDVTHRLFVVYREPAELQVINAVTGNVTARVPISGDPDDIFYDSTNSRLYISCGQGFVDVISSNGGTYHEAATVPTGAGARTSLYVPSLGRLYVAVPDYTGSPAKIEAFATHKII